MGKTLSRLRPLVAFTVLQSRTPYYSKGTTWDKVELQDRDKSQQVRDRNFNLSLGIDFFIDRVLSLTYTS